LYKKIIAALAMLMLFTPAFSSDLDATKAVLNWLNMVDKSNYGKSWEEASNVFKKQISKSQWNVALSNSRDPLGSISNRETSQVFDLNEMPNLPKGQYRVYIFNTDFENKLGASEVVTVFSKNNKWLVVGYVIN
jgi:hypothetical protein